MTLQERLDADLRGQLRRGRPLPVVMPEVLGEPNPALSPAQTGLASCTPAMVAQCLARASVTMVESKAQTEAVYVPLHFTMRQLLTLVSEASGVSVKDLTSPRRARHLARPRQVVMWLARKHTPYSLPEIGRNIGHRDHTTVMHGCKVIDRLLGEHQPDISELVESCERTHRELIKHP